MDSRVTRSQRDGDTDQAEPENVVSWGSLVSDFVGAEELAGLLFVQARSGVLGWGRDGHGAIVERYCGDVAFISDFGLRREFGPGRGGRGSAPVWAGVPHTALTTATATRAQAAQPR